jgi:hypothetical protein
MGKVACERCRLLWLIDKARDTAIDRYTPITVWPTNPGAAPGHRQRSYREAHTGARLARPLCCPHPRAAHINEVCALQEFCKTPAATYLRERLGRCPHKTVKTHPPARVPRN